MSEYTPESIDRLAQVIRAEDGDHSLGAGALAEAIILSDWHTEVIRAAKVEALREAVEEFENHVGPEEFSDQAIRVDDTHWYQIEMIWEYQGPFMNWLENRADRIERSDDER